MIGLRSFQFDAIGTHWKIDAQCGDDVIKVIRDRIEVFDRSYSRFREDSLVTEIATRGGTFLLPDDAGPMLSLYESLYRQTNGAFTPLIGNLLSDAGYDATYSLSPKEIRAPKTWDEAISLKLPEITVSQGEILDFGAGGKGYLIDIVSNLLSAHGIESFCVDAGGDIVQKSHENIPLHVGLEHPLDMSLAIGVASICNQSIAGSAGNRRKWGKYHHIFDPKTHDSTHDVLATWVVAPTGLLADSLATCLFLVDPEVLSDNSFEYLLLYPDSSIKRSANFPAEIFTS